MASREDAETDEASAESPRIESAIPAEDDPTSKVAVLDQMPHTKPLLIAAVASALLVGSLALLITHPWNPDQYSIRATEEADTSMAGFPGTVETLTGQDQDPDDVSSADLSGDDATFAELVEIHEKLGSYVERARENEALFRSIAFTEDLAQREEGKRKADALAIDIDNLDESLGEVDVSSGTYAEEHTHLVALNDWLRTYVTSLCVAWDADVDSENPQEDEAALLLLLESDYDEGNMSRHLELFEKNYENWKPQQKAAE